MSQSSLYHEHGISVYRYQSTIYKNGKTYVQIYLPSKEYRCPCCGSDNVWVKETVVREFRSVPIGNREFIIIASIPKFYCHDCKSIRQASIPFARPKKHYTKRFERYVLSLLRGATVQFVADLLGVSWATIRDIEKEYLRKHFANPSLKNVKYIAIDEIATKKGHVYMTVVLDLETGLVLYVGEGRDQNALLPFWKRLRKSRTKIFGVATDMSPAFTAAVREHLPDTFQDRFHVTKCLTK